MANEIMLERPVDLDFQPAKLEFTNYEELKALVEKYADRYKNLVFTRENKSSAIKARTELLSIVNAIESNRKNVKQVYNKPLNEFEQQIKELTGSINEPLNQIRSGLKEIDDNEKQERQDVLNRILSKLVESKSITLDDVQIDAKWLNKGNWNDKLRPITKLQAELEQAVDEAVKVKQQRETDLKILTEFCKAKDIDPVGWVSQLDFKSVTEVMDLINTDVERKRKIAEGQAAKQQEFEQQKAQQEAVVEEAADSEETPIPDDPLITDVIQVTGTLSQLNGLNKYLVEHGIQVAMVNENTTDDLPF
ncbi:hypothetical protein FC84_GL001674 [Lapidilactobacillus dextrinicus DSM 20335]|uniref:DUF1351 domain-containing protein n=1 Tax=Lapidilactobacillus dextrinicus DSM 20335 TaxID=1423738 RepID=A0A0R2BKT1_9LACO|nr:DUF1351 domain-containing protein [Lapidilactobacillus dextrinicus]KRM79493.1 hypothetical protein FC84_GL001674 [Lapidilactobacillus dextrinicus DSM 20335]QFG46673.1 DUF1351 domain-containing protein [Lapidilactobacillus dextrinicus]